MPSKSGALKLAAHRLEIRAGGVHSTLRSYLSSEGEAINQELRALAHPWDGVVGLVRIALQSSGDPTRTNQDPLIEFVAPLAAGIVQELTTLKAGELKSTIWVASPAIASGCTVGFIAEFADGGYLNGAVPLERPRRSSTNTVPFSLSLPGQTVGLTLLLHVGSHLVQSFALQDSAAKEQNADLVSYQTFDPGLANLRTALKLTASSKPTGGKNPAPQFEGAVARVFSLAGFHTDHLDTYTGMNAAIDVLASTPDRTTILAIECTVGSLQSAEGKPDRLKIRAAAVAEALDNKHRVISVIATSRKRGTLLDSELEMAALDGISILYGEDLMELLTFVEQGATPSDVVRRCREAIPSRSDPRPLAHLISHGRIR